MAFSSGAAFVLSVQKLWHLVYARNSSSQSGHFAFSFCKSCPGTETQTFVEPLTWLYFGVLIKAHLSEGKTNWIQINSFKK